MSYTCPKCGLEGYSAFCYKCGHQTIKDEDSSYYKNARNGDRGSLNFQKEIEKLNNTIVDLRRKGKKAVASRDGWKRRAEDAEYKIHKLENGFTNNDSKFQKIKTKFAKMYHPDNIVGNKYEKLIKQEIFKEFWEEIENIDKE